MKPASSDLVVHSYILRVWAEYDSAENAPNWRVSITDIPNGKRHGFGSLDEAFAYLLTTLNPPPSVCDGAV